MIINSIDGCTRRIGKSQGYLTLPLRDEVSDGIPFMTSSWQPTPDELAAIASGAPIYVSIMGSAHPPIMVYVGPKPEAST